jgi:hypothetical protein
MNTNHSAVFQRLSRHIPFTALLATAAFRAEAPLFFRSFLVHQRSAPAVIHRRAFLILSLCADWARGKWVQVERPARRSSIVLGDN